MPIYTGPNYCRPNYGGPNYSRPNNRGHCTGTPWKIVQFASYQKNIFEEVSGTSAKNNLRDWVKSDNFLSFLNEPYFQMRYSTKSNPVPAIKSKWEKKILNIYKNIADQFSKLV